MVLIRFKERNVISYPAVGFSTSPSPCLNSQWEAQQPADSTRINVSQSCSLAVTLRFSAFIPSSLRCTSLFSLTLRSKVKEAEIQLIRNPQGALSSDYHCYKTPSCVLSGAQELPKAAELLVQESFSVIHWAEPGQLTWRAEQTGLGSSFLFEFYRHTYSQNLMGWNKM